MFRFSVSLFLSRVIAGLGSSGLGAGRRLSLFSHGAGGARRDGAELNEGLLFRTDALRFYISFGAYLSPQQ